jgi:phospholipase/carboxylesterase
MLETVEIAPASTHRSTVIWLHGLGADGHDFEPIVPYLGLDPALGIRFVFPHAPERSVTVNGGMVMRAWYDIVGLDIADKQDDRGVRDSEGLIRELMVRERGRGIPSERIVLAGFSQGGAVALHTALRHPEPLAGIVALSAYLPLDATVADERHPANADTPIFMAHGQADPVVPILLGQGSRTRLEALGYTVEWHEYPMAHEVNLEEIRAIGQWLSHVLAVS